MENKNKLFTSIGIVLLMALVIVFAVLLINKNKPQAKFDGEITIIVVAENDDELFNQKVKFKEGQTFKEIIGEHLNIEYEVFDFGSMIVSINNVKPGEKQFWAIYVNNESSMTGVDTQEFANGDVFKFVLESWE